MMEEGTTTCVKIKVEFYEASGVKSCVRFSTDLETINIVKSMLQSSDTDYKNSTVQKLLKSDRFGSEIQDSVVFKLSKMFTNFLASKECPLRNQDFFSNSNDVESMNLDNLLEKCIKSCPRLVEAINQILFGTVHDYNKKRLLTVLMISGFTQNQKINLIPKLIGEFLKRKNCSKQGLELLQRCGVTLVSKSVSREQDKIGETFLDEVEERKKSIVLWAERRKILENKATLEEMTADTSNGVLKVNFLDDNFAPKMVDIGQ